VFALSDSVFKLKIERRTENKKLKNNYFDESLEKRKIDFRSLSH